MDNKKIVQLEKVLENYSEILSRSEAKDQIIKAFTFEQPVARIELYREKNKRTAQLIRELEPFFFVEEVFFHPNPTDSGICELILISRFKNLLAISKVYAQKYNGRFDLATDASYILFNTPQNGIVEHPSSELLKALKSTINKYRDEFEDDGAEDQILRAFAFEKPVTSIELTGKIPDIITDLINDFNEFFFVKQGYSEPELLEFVFTGDIFISRFENLVDIINDYSHAYFGALDRFADVSGLFLGLPLREVAQFCSSKRIKKKYDLLK